MTPPHLVKPAPNALQRALRNAGETPVQVWVPRAEMVERLTPWVEAARCQVLHPQGPDLCRALDDQLAQAAGPDYPIPGGGKLTIETTRAVTAIDVDADRSSSQPTGSALALNLRAATEIARLAYLHEMGGSIVVDFITLKKPDERAKLQAHLAAALALDPAQPELVPMSRFGLVEINRRRTGEALLTRLKWPLYVAGDILLQLWRGRPYRQPLKLAVNPEVAAILQARLTHEAALAHLGVTVDITPDPARLATDYAVMVG